MITTNNYLITIQYITTMTLSVTQEIEKYNVEIDIDIREQITLMCISALNEFNKLNKTLRLEFYVPILTEIYIRDKETGTLYYYDTLRFTTNESATTKLGNMKLHYFVKALRFAYSQITI